MNFNFNLFVTEPQVFSLLKCVNYLTSVAVARVSVCFSWGLLSRLSSVIRHRSKLSALYPVFAPYQYFRTTPGILMYIPWILCTLLSRPTNAQHMYTYIYVYIHIYLYINNILYIKVLLRVSMHLHHLQGVSSFYFAKVTEVIKITNSVNLIRLKCSRDRFRC